MTRQVKADRLIGGSNCLQKSAFGVYDLDRSRFFVCTEECYLKLTK